MWKTKLIEVKASEKLPPEKGEYLAVIDEELSFAAIFPFDPGDEEDVYWWKTSVDYWLERVPDHEEDMREMLERLTNHYEDVLKGDFSNFSLRSDIDSARELLAKLKTKES